MHFCNVYLNIDIYQSWHGAEYNMSKYFTSFLNLAILFASISANEMTAYYQKREFGLQKFMFYGNHIKNFSFYFIFQVLKMLLPYYISNILINIIITSLKM